MATTPTVYVGVLYINYGNYGWSEKYAVSDLNYDAAVLLFASFCRWRAAIMAPGCMIVWARVSLAGSPKESRAALTEPLPSLKVNLQPPNISPINDPDTALHFRLETAEGRHADRLVRGIPDHFVEDFRLAPLIPAPTVIEPLPVLAAELSDLATIRGFMTVLKTLTLHVRGNHDTPLTYTTTPWATVIYRGIRSRKTGRPFGMSRGRAPTRG